MNPFPGLIRSLNHRTLRPVILLASIATLVSAEAVKATDAVFSSGAFTGDATSGVSTSKTYVALANVIGGDVAVNGETFIGSGNGLSGAGWSLAGAPSPFATEGNHTTTFGGSMIDDLFDGFQYDGNPGLLTMNGLTAGKTYTVTLYNQAWALPDSRFQNVSSSEGASIVYNQDALEASLLRYTFVAAGVSTVLNIAPLNAGSSMHVYGLSNEEVFTNKWTGGAAWTTATWSGGTPNGVGTNATFTAQNAATGINLDAPQTVGHVSFDGANPWTLSTNNNSMLTFQADAAGVSVISTASGSHTISAPVQFNSPLAKFGAGTIRLTGQVAGSGKGATIGSGVLAIESPTADLTSIGNVVNSGGFSIINGGAQKFGGIISGTGDLTKAGAGVLTLSGINTYSGSTTVSQGTLSLAGRRVAVLNAGFENTGSLGAGGWTYNPTGADWTFDAGSGISSNNQPWVNTALEGTHAGFLQNTFISQVMSFGAAANYDFSFLAANRPGHNPNGLLLQIDGVTVSSLPATGFQTGANFQPYRFASVPVSAGSHTVAFVANNEIGGDTATAIDAIFIASTDYGTLPSGTALNLSASGAAVDVNGHDQTIGSLAGVAGTSVQNIGSLTVGGNNATTGFAGVISGAGGLTKVGAGTLQISGPNTYGGSTTISGGTVRLIGAGALPATSPVSLTTAGATLAVENTAAISSLTGVSNSALSLAGGSLTVGSSDTSTTFGGTVSGSGSFTKTGAGLLTLTGPLAYSGSISISGGTLKMQQTNSGTPGAMSVASGATWDLGLSSQAVTGLTGAGTITRSGTISTGVDGSALISPSNNYIRLIDFGNNGPATVNGVTFTDEGPSGTGYQLTGAGSLFPDNGASTGYDQLVSDFYYDGKPGVLTFTNLTPGQTYKSVVYTKVGIWGPRPQDATFDEDPAGPVASQLLNTDPQNVGYYAYEFVAHSPSMNISMQALSPGSFHWFGASLQGLSTTTPTLTIGDSGNYSYTGVINGPTALIKQGSGSQSLSGVSNYSGGTTISNGTIFGHHSAALGTGPVSIASGGNYLAWWNAGSPAIANSFTLNGPGGSPDGSKSAIYADGGGAGHGEYTITGSVTLAASSNISGNNLNNIRIMGPVTGPGGLTKGSGRGDENSTLILANPANDYAGETIIANGTIKLGAAEVIPNGPGKGGVTVNAGTTFDLGGFGETINHLSGAGTVTTTGSATVGAPVFFTDDSGTGISTGKSYTHALDFSGGPGLSVNSVPFTAAGLSGANWSLTGAALSTGSPNTGATGNISTLLSNFFFNGSTASLTLTGLTPGTTYETHLYERQWGADFNRSQFFTVQSGTQTGAAIYNEDGSATPNYLPFRYTADASGTATISTYQIGDGTYHWYGMTNEAVAASAMPVLTVGDATDSAFTGSITGSLTLAKQGAGTLSLGGSNTFSGVTTVNGGKLIVSGALSGTVSVQVNSGTLGGSGSINPAANVSVSAGGVIAPGVGIGTLSTGPLAFADGSAFTLEIGATASDKLLIAGAGMLSGTVMLNLSLLADPLDSTLFTVLDGTSLLTGYASGARFSYAGQSLPDGAVFTVNDGSFTQDFKINYLADGGNDVTLLAVPEPGSAASLLLGLASVCARRWRKK